MFNTLKNINTRPQLFGIYTTPDMWNDDYISKQMLEFHLNPESELASRNIEFIQRSIDWIVDKFQIVPGTQVCDFGCGPGLYTTGFAETGADVTGVDLSTNSINYARKKTEDNDLQINYVNQNYLEFETDKKFDLITMIYCDLCVLNPEQRKKLFENFSKFLKPDGQLLLDVFSLNMFTSFQESATFENNSNGGFWSPDPHYVFKNTFLFQDEKVFCDKYNIFEENREREIYNWLQCYSLETIKAEFEENGFEVTECFANVAGDKFNSDTNEIALIAKKRR